MRLEIPPETITFISAMEDLNLSRDKLHDVADTFVADPADFNHDRLMRRACGHAVNFNSVLEAVITRDFPYSTPDLFNEIDYIQTEECEERADIFNEVMGEDIITDIEIPDTTTLLQIYEIPRKLPFAERLRKIEMGKFILSLQLDLATLDHAAKKQHDGN